MTIEVRRIKDILEEALNELEMFDDDDLVKTSCNTYGLSSRFISLGRDGFLDLYDIRVEENDE